jgi:hypothetical protein
MLGLPKLLSVVVVQMTSPPKLPDDVGVWMVGNSHYHDTLNECLSKYAFGKFWVTNEHEEKEMRAVRCIFDDAVHSSNDGGGVLLYLLRDGDHEAQFRLLLSLGMDPDKLREYKQSRPSHFTTRYARPSCARALAPCRPRVTALDEFGKTPCTTDAVSIWS